MLDLQSLISIISEPTHIACFILGFLSALAFKWSPEIVKNNTQVKLLKTDLKALHTLHKQTLEEVQTLKACIESKEREIKVLQNKLYTRGSTNIWRL